ncbi:MAG: CHASE2 domain-containing protein [Candidatus Omnitrophota bacterium]|nr:MAG: CHASE2 domain-containing protein [Candidatus Omnitrophota bacterium]
MLRFFKSKSFTYPLIIWAIVAVWYLIFAAGLLTPSRLKTQDLFTQQAFYLFTEKPPVSEKIVIVAIDEGSRRHLNLKWPWKRSVTAQLISNISSFSPKIIALDIIFSGKSEEKEDIRLVEALRSHPDIILGHTLGDDEKDKTELPYQEFMAAAKGAGYITKPVEADEVVRNIRPFYIDKDKNSYVSIELETFNSYLESDFEKAKVTPLTGGDIIPINYLVHPNSFYTIPAYLVLEKKIGAEIFKDKIVLVGATDPLIHDEHLTPFGTISGVSIIANALVMMLSNRYLVNLPLWQIFLAIFILSNLIILLTSRLRLAFSTFFTAIILFMLFIGSLYLRSLDFQFDYFSSFFLIISSYVVSNIYKYSYLIYMSTKLKNIAIMDSLTGFYTFRYFTAKLNQDLKERPENISFIALLVSNYRRLILDLSFEELKSLIKLLAEFIQSSFKKRFKTPIFARISEDIIGVSLREENQTAVNEFFKMLTDRLGKVEFKIEEKIIKIIPKGVLIHTPKGRKVSGTEIVHNMETTLGNLKENPQENIRYLNLEDQVLETKKASQDEDILDFVASDLEERNKDLEKSLKALLESKKETEAAYFEAIRSLIKALEEKDTYTQGHSERVAKYALALAKELQLPQEECDNIYKATLLHDIGKIGIPDNILHKKASLTDEEFDLIKKHEIMSVEILKPIKPFNELLPIILHHHEKFDGTGYPHGLSGDMIPRGAQILAVADVFDAITCGRGYKKGATVEEAIKELEKNKGTQFNPAYVDVFKQAVSSGKIKF